MGDDLKSLFVLVRLNNSGGIKEENELFESARCADEVGKVMRMHPSGLMESLSREVIASQSVPGWSAFNALLYPESPEIGVVGY